jgi:choline dehydrogenase-like flavoprotein
VLTPSQDIFPPTFSLGGSISINSSNPFDPPLIDPGVLSSDFDLFTLREALKRAQKFVSAPAWKNYIIAPTEDLENITSKALDQHIRNSAFAGLHMVGTAGMSARNADYGVVDPDLLVKGVSRLRIIDASVIVRDLFKFESIWYSHISAHCAGCTPSGRSICICGERIGLDQA